MYIWFQNRFRRRMKMLIKSSVFWATLIVQCLSVFCASDDYDFYYFVQQWPASLCDTKRGCCYPKTGKPAEDFGIHGLWPNRNDGSWPRFCERTKSFNASQISDLIPRMQKDWPTLACPTSDGMRFWSHEWEKHGTCSLLNQHEYFKTALDLKEKASTLQVLKKAGIVPNGDFYKLESIEAAIKEGFGYSGFTHCNFDKSKNQQVQEIYLCVHKTTLEFIDCPTHSGRCRPEIEFPPFNSYSPLVTS